MPHLPIVQCDASITTQNIRKRKRETVLADISPALSNRLSSSAIHDTNPQFCLDNTGCLGDSTGVFTRQRCLHRKRRVFQQPPANHKPPFTDAAANTMCICVLPPPMSYLPPETDYSRIAAGFSGPLQAVFRKGLMTTNGRQSGHARFALLVQSKVSPNLERK
ncbi:hypothetical protein CBS63078_10680 [Aspergillus niger]|nr:hypothetical protein CBS115989_8962 [Aspergillus niger]KAI2816739.1 hypothetical protein CBS133816_10607 [Aspergillus niger]KAI2842423.1 hypothetical protein CBS11232_8542 [Aspergillus niger]KAI2870721.1 hypothetical protein CBS11852_11082 [Aspergillus niger]KAI2871075.1 hypothetical protein CBS115988_8837 [Aspergillus niger]